MTGAEDGNRRARQLLPFWVNGTLAPDEAAEVEAALAASAVLRDEAEVLRQLRGNLQASPPDYSPGAFGLARLERAIAAEAPTSRRNWRLAGAAAIAATLAAFAVYVGGPATGPEPDLYRQASGDASGHLLTVTFRPDATGAEIAGLLLRQGLVIVDGPSALGLYRLSLAEDAEPAAAAEALRARADVIETVELPE